MVLVAHPCPRKINQYLLDPIIFQIVFTGGNYYRWTSISLSTRTPLLYIKVERVKEDLDLRRESRFRFDCELGRNTVNTVLFRFRLRETLSAMAPFRPPCVMGDESIMSQKGHGTSEV